MQSDIHERQKILKKKFEKANKKKTGYIKRANSSIDVWFFTTNINDMNTNKMTTNGNKWQNVLFWMGGIIEVV